MLPKLGFKPTLILLFSLSSLVFSSCSATDANTKKAFQAVKEKNWDKAIELVEEGVAQDAMTDKGYTLLHLSEDPALTSLLIKNGNNVNLKSGGLYSKKEKRDLLDGAMVMTGVSKKMAAIFEDINENDPYFGDNFAPLHTVQNPEAIKVLLDRGADPNAIALFGITPIAKVRSPEGLKYLLDAGAKLLITKQGNSPLQEGLERNRYQEFNGGEDAYFSSIKLYVEAGADLISVNNNGSNVLHAANNKATPKMLSYLLKNGANPKLDDIGWGGAFCHAIKKTKDDLLLTYAQHDFTLLYHECDGNRSALEYAKDETKNGSSTYNRLVAMDKIVQSELEKP